MKTKIFRNSKCRQGLTLVEILITAVLILVVWGGTFQGLYLAMGLNRTNRHMEIAMRDLTTLMEYMSSLSAEGRAVLFSSQPIRYFPVDWDCSTSPCVPRRGMEPDYTFVGGQKSVSQNEVIRYYYWYSNYTKDPMAPDAPSPEVLEVELTAQWSENGRQIGPLILRSAIR